MEQPAVFVDDSGSGQRQRPLWSGSERITQHIDPGGFEPFVAEIPVPLAYDAGQDEN